MSKKTVTVKLTFIDSASQANIDFVKFLKKNMKQYLSFGIRFKFLSVSKAEEATEYPILEFNDKEISGVKEIKETLNSFVKTTVETKEKERKLVSSTTDDNYESYMAAEAKLSAGQKAVEDDDEAPEKDRFDAELRRKSERMTQERSKAGMHMVEAETSSAPKRDNNIQPASNSKKDKDDELLMAKFGAGLED